MTASCAWSGFVLAALIGLYLKHFLNGARLRRQFTATIFLLTVTGLDICVNLWNILYLHDSLPGYLEMWKAGQISSWFHSIIWDPHHIASMACCMFAFLLAWMAGKRGHLATNIVLIAMALASAFGLSIYVAFAFFLVMLTWALWQLAIERTSRPALVLGSGGIGAAVLLVPYLKDLTHASSNLQEGSVFAFAVRETIPPDRLLASPLFQHLASSYPAVSQNLANLTLLAPGYVVELGFFLFVLILYLVPAWRGRIALTAAQRSLIFIATATLLLMSFVRSGVLVTNDFGWRTALLLQFPLLLLASELVMSWRLADKKLGLPADFAGLPQKTPRWLRSIATIGLVIGIYTTLYQALEVRFTLPLLEFQTSSKQDFALSHRSQKAYISLAGYAQLDSLIPRDAVVQFNPAELDPLWNPIDWSGIDHQAAIIDDQMGCGSELGGDPSGCPAMAASIDSLFNGASAEQARATCHQYGIQYLVTRIYDPAWKDKSGWVWTLAPVVADKEFRALDCRQMSQRTMSETRN